MSKRTLRNLIISASIFGVVVGVVLFAFFHVLNSSQTLEEQIAAVAAQTQQEETLLRLQRIAQNSVEEREELGSYFLLRESDSIAFLSEIEAIAPTVGIDLETTGLVQITQDNKNWIQATFSLTGSRDNVQRFVRILENIPYVSRITSVNMTGNTAGTWQADVVIQVQLLSYD
jgi:hypothetical protein